MHKREGERKGFFNKFSRFMLTGTKALLAIGATLLGAVVGGLIYGILDFLAHPESFRAGKKPEPSSDSAPGRAEVLPLQIRTSDRRQVVVVRFIAGKGGISEGGGIKVGLCRTIHFGKGRRRVNFVLSYGWGPLQNTRPRSDNYFSVEVRSRNRLSLEVERKGSFPLRLLLRILGRNLLRKKGAILDPPDLTYLLLEQSKIKIRIVGGRLEEGEEIVITLGDTRFGGRGWKVPFHPVLTEFLVEVDERALGRYRPIESFPSLKVTGRVATALEVYLSTFPEQDKTRKGVTRAVDGEGNIDPAFAGEVELGWADRAYPQLTLTLDTSHAGSKTFILKSEGSASPPGKSGYLRARARLDRRVLQGRSNPLVGEDQNGFHLYWGDIHIHSALCDGTAGPHYVYERARDLEGLDFAALSPHDTLGSFEPTGRTTDEIELIRELVDSYNRQHGFAAFLGYEWTHPAEGHRNIYFAPHERDPVFCDYLHPQSDTLEKLLARLEGKDYMMVPHHPAWRKMFWLPCNWLKFIRPKLPPNYNWGKPGERAVRLVEIYGGHGCSESFHGPFPITHGKREGFWPAFLGDDRGKPGYGAYIQEALALGYRFGFIGGSDRHDHAVDERKYPVTIYPHGLAAVWARSCTAPEIWEGLNQRRTYSTSGARIFLFFRANGLFMGEEGRLPSEVEISFRVMGTAPLLAIHLVKYDLRGYDTKTWAAERDFEPGTMELEEHLRDGDLVGDTFYYLRIAQQDGHWAWSSPIWLDQGERADQ